MKGTAFFTLFLAAILLPLCGWASDRIHFTVTNNTSSDITITGLNTTYCYLVYDQSQGPCDSNSCAASYTVAPGSQQLDLCSVVQDANLGDSISYWTFYTNDTYQYAIITDPTVGPCNMSSGCNAGQSCSLVNQNNGEYNLDIRYGGSSPVPTMSMPVTTFEMHSQGGGCFQPNVVVNNPGGAVSVGGAGSWASNSTCTGAMASCTFGLNVSSGSSGTAIVSDGISKISIYVSCGGGL